MAPSLLFLVYRQGKGCKQYPFTTIEDLDKWASRKPYVNESLNVLCFVERKQVAAISCMGNQAGCYLRDWFDLMVSVKTDFKAAA